MFNFSKKIVILLSCCSFFIGFDAIITAPLIPEIAKSIHINENHGALLVTSYAFFYFVSAPFFGLLSDRYGRMPILTAGLFLLFLGTGLTGFASNLANIFIFRGITGIGAGMIQPTVFAIISDHFPYEKRANAIGMIMGALMGSTLIGIPIGTWLAQFFSWRVSFWLCSILILFLLFVINRTLKNKVETVKTTNFTFVKQLSTALKNPIILLSLISSFLWYAGLQGMMSNIGVYYDQFHVLVSIKGLILMAAGAGSILGSIYGGRIADKLGKLRVMKASILFTALGVMIVGNIHYHLALAIFAHFFWSTCFGVGQATLTALNSELNPLARGTILSLNSSFMYLGMMVASSISVIFLTYGNFRWLGLFCALMTVFVFITIHIVFKETKNTISDTSLNS